MIRPLANIYVALLAGLNNLSFMMVVRRFQWTGWTKMGSSWRYFKDSDVVGLDRELVAMLDMARGKSGVPFIITSGLRTFEANMNAGGVPDSAHLTGHAVDLRCKDSHSRFKMTEGLLYAGFKRIIHYRLDGHIHVDNSTDKTQEILEISE